MAISSDKRLVRIAEDLAAGRPVTPVSVREFLGWFDAQRRGSWIVTSIRDQLSKHNLDTDPDFESAYIDAPISFTSTIADSSASAQPLVDGAGETPESPIPEGDVIPNFVSRDPTHRISKLAAANQRIFSVKPDAPISEAVTILMSKDFSQVPVMTNEREVKGVVSWKTLGVRLAVGKPGEFVRDFMEPHHEIRSDRSIFEAISVVVSSDYVLVRSPDNRISGIVTASDLSLQFRSLSEPFLLIGEIENQIRALIGAKFSGPELIDARDPSDLDRKVDSVEDLTFGEYLRLLENEKRWSKLELRIDRATFCKDLDRVRSIRNDVMHFDPDGIPPDDLSALRDFANFLKQLQAISQ